jgi:hypothetical protein
VIRSYYSNFLVNWILFSSDLIFQFLKIQVLIG